MRIAVGSDHAGFGLKQDVVPLLTQAGRRLEEGAAPEIIERFLATDFEGGRHQRRVDQIAAVERGETSP